MGDEKENEEPKLTMTMEPYHVRRGRAKSIFLGKPAPRGRRVSVPGSGRHLTSDEIQAGLENLTGEVLLDSFLLLYNETKYRTGTKKVKGGHDQFFVNKYAKSAAALRKNLMSVTDFNFGVVIGRGQFGQVRLAKEDQGSGRIFAVKIFKMQEPIFQKNLLAIDNELHILSSIKSDWLVQLKYSFQDSKFLYFFLDYLPGGNFLNLLQRFGPQLPEESTKFYLAETILAIHALHSFGYVHRDIKPENLVLDRLGHLKLVDFGSSAPLNCDGKVIGRLIMGTCPNHVAPEVLQSLEDDDNDGDDPTLGQVGSYGMECDYWSVGVMAYECLFGLNPFVADTNLNIFNNIIGYKTHLQIPKDPSTSLEFRDLLSGLLTDQKNRLGYDQLLRHPFFDSIIWDGIRDEIPPHIPVVKGEEDASNFSKSNNSAPKFSPPDDNLHGPPRVSLVGFTRSLQNVRIPGLNPAPNKPASANISMNSSTSDSTFFLHGENDTVKGNTCAHLRAELDTKNDFLKEKIAQITTLSKKLESTSDLVTSKDDQIAQLSSNLKRLQLEKEQLVQERDEERAYSSELESKSKDLVASIRASGQKELTDLRGELLLHQNLIVERNTQILESQKVVEELRTEISKLEEELQKAETRNGESQRKVRQNYRGSINLIESRLTQTCQESENRLAECQKLHALELESIQSNFQSRETQLNQLLAKTKTDISELQGRLEESRKSREETLKDFGTLQQAHVSMTRELDAEIKCLRQKNSDLEKINCTKALESVQILETELRKTRQDRDRLSLKIEDLQLEGVKKESEIQKLATIIDCLEKSVQCMEDRRLELLEQTQTLLTCNRGQTFDMEQGAVAVLQGQLDRCQENLEGVKSQLFEEKQKNKELTLAMDTIEDQFGSTKYDLRVLTREKKEVDDKLDKMVKELDTVQQIRRGLEDEHFGLEIKVQDLQKKVTSMTQEVAAGQVTLAETVKLLQDSKETKQFLVQDFERVAKEYEESKEKLLEYERFRVILGEKEMELKGKELLMEEKDRKIEDLNLNIERLKGIIIVFEDQLKDLEAILAKKEAEAENFVKSKISLDKNLTFLQDELKKSRTLTNETQSLHSFAETRLKDTEATLLAEESRREKQVRELEKRLTDLKSILTKKEGRITELEAGFEEVHVKLRNHKSQMEAVTVENHSLKLETSKNITQLVQLRESNNKLKSSLEEAVDKCESYKARLDELLDDMSTLECEKLETESRLQATLTQQIQLIDYLQEKNVSKAKKRTFLGGKIFGREGKEAHSAREKDILNLLTNTTTTSSQQNGQQNSKNQPNKMLPPAPSPAGSSASTGYAHGQVAGVRFIPPTPVTPMIFPPAGGSSSSSSSKGKSGQKVKQPRSASSSSASSSFSSSDSIRLDGNGRPKKLIQKGLTRLHQGSGILKNGREKDFKIKKCGPVTKLEKVKVQNVQFGPDESESNISNSTAESSTDFPFELVPPAAAATEAVFSQQIILEEIDTPVEQRLKINCVRELTRDVFLLGCDQGLFSRKVAAATAATVEDGQKRAGSSVKIEGIGGVHQMEFIFEDNLAILLEGKDRRLISMPYGLLEACAKAAACSRPAISYDWVANLTSVVSFHVQRRREEVTSSSSGSSRLDGHLVVVQTDQILILDWHKAGFIIKHKLKTPQPAHCLLTVGAAAFIWCGKLFTLNFQDWTLDEFINDSASYDFYCGNGSGGDGKNDGGRPVAILDVGRSNLAKGETVYSPEFLVCFNDLAVFLDAHGRKMSGREEIVWSKVPLALAYHHPNLFVTHFNSIEVIQLDKESYTRTRTLSDLLTDPKLETALSKIPISHFLPLDNPRIVGHLEGQGSKSSIIVVNESKNKMELVEVAIVDQHQHCNNFLEGSSSVFELSQSLLTSSQNLSNQSTSSGNSSSDVTTCSSDCGGSSSSCSSIYGNWPRQNPASGKFNRAMLPMAVAAKAVSWSNLQQAQSAEKLTSQNRRAPTPGSQSKIVGKK